MKTISLKVFEISFDPNFNTRDTYRINYQVWFSTYYMLKALIINIEPMILNKEKMKNTQHGLLSRKIIRKLVTKGITLTMKLITCKCFFFLI